VTTFSPTISSYLSRNLSKRGSAEIGEVTNEDDVRVFAFKDTKFPMTQPEETAIDLPDENSIAAVKQPGPSTTAY
jgi:hypothetical protein